MSPATVLPGWYPLLLSRDLRARPVTRCFAGSQLILRRTAEGCIEVKDRASEETRSAAEAGGWIFVAHGTPAAESSPASSLISAPLSQILVEGHVQATLGDVGENILDTTHTSVVHQNYLRRPGERRAVEAIITSGETWISATYPPGAAPSGWGARLLGAHRYTICDQFRAPSIAEVTYTDEGAPVFAARFHLTPAAPGETYVAATIAVPGAGALAAIKLAALRLFFQRIFAEDRAILELIGANREVHRGGPLVFTPQDLLRPGIEAILSGRQPDAPSRSIALMV